MSRNVKELEEKIGYNFKDSHLLRHAVTHSSYVNEKHMKKADCNERLEFLGDAVLELISSEYLARRHLHFVRGIWNLEVICCLGKVRTRPVEDSESLLPRMHWKH